MDINRKRKLSSASNGDDKSLQQGYSDDDEGTGHLQNMDNDDEDGYSTENKRFTSDDLDTQRMIFNSSFLLHSQTIMLS